jgi:putative transposase
MNPLIRAVIKGGTSRLPIRLLCVRWYAAYPLSLRHLEEMIAERGLSIDHATVHRWALKLLLVMTWLFRPHKKAVGFKWRMDET